MIAFVEGRLVEKHPTHVVVDVGGVGLAVYIPLSSYRVLGEVDSRVRVETHLHVREDMLQLYGFSTSEEKRLFEQLVSVSGIGPKLALSILSGTSVTEFAKAILSEDLKALSSIPGVGKKTAQRLVVELKETMNKAGIGPALDLPVTAPESREVVEDAILGLMSLGYERAAARQSVARAAVGVDGNLTAEMLIRRALQGGR